MTIPELKALRRGDRVRFLRDGVARPTDPGTVVAADERCAEVWWEDGTSTLIWFAHCEDGRDVRHTFLTRVEE